MNKHGVFDQCTI